MGIFSHEGNPYTRSLLRGMAEHGSPWSKITRCTEMLYTHLIGRMIACMPTVGVGYQTHTGDESIEQLPMAGAFESIVVYSLSRAGVLPGITACNVLMDAYPESMISHDIVSVSRVPEGDGFKAVVDSTKARSSTRDSLIIIPDLTGATGTSVRAAIEHAEKMGPPRRYAMVCAVVAESFVDTMVDEYRNFDIFAVRVDPKLDDHGYIRPGIGDAGDLLCNTRLP